MWLQVLTLERILPSPTSLRLASWEADTAIRPLPAGRCPLANIISVWLPVTVRASQGAIAGLWRGRALDFLCQRPSNVNKHVNKLLLRPHLSCSSSPPNTLGQFSTILVLPTGGILVPEEQYEICPCRFSRVVPLQARHSRFATVPVIHPALRRLKTDKDDSAQTRVMRDCPTPACCLPTQVSHSSMLKGWSARWSQDAKNVLKVWVTSWGFQILIRSEKWIGAGSELLDSFKPLKTSHWPLSFPTECSSFFIWGHRCLRIWRELWSTCMHVSSSRGFRIPESHKSLMPALSIA